MARSFSLQEGGSGAAEVEGGGTAAGLLQPSVRRVSGPGGVYMLQFCGAGPTRPVLVILVPVSRMQASSSKFTTALRAFEQAELKGEPKQQGDRVSGRPQSARLPLPDPPRPQAVPNLREAKCVDAPSLSPTRLKEAQTVGLCKPRKGARRAGPRGLLGSDAWLERSA